MSLSLSLSLSSLSSICEPLDEGLHGRAAGDGGTWAISLALKTQLLDPEQEFGNKLNMLYGQDEFLLSWKL